MPKLYSLTADSLYDIISSYSECKRIWVAFSGGMDSHVLLHILKEISNRLDDVELGTVEHRAIKLRAIHIDHGLNEKSALWAEHCQHVCDSYNIPLEILCVNAKHEKGESPEEIARQARYNAFASILQKDDCIVTAHHEDDQAETLLIQLARGCGPAGLASMPRIIQFHCGWLARPLLDFSRDQLVTYAKDANLKWIEDPSNVNVDYDRNYIRHNVLPILKARWPKITTTISRTAQHNADVSQLLKQLAQMDLKNIQGTQANTLSVSALLSVDEKRRNNVIRTWIKNLGLPLPQAIHLDHINHDVLMARSDAQPKVKWDRCTISRYRDLIYAMQPLPPHDSNKTYQWNLLEPITVPGIGTLSVTNTHASGLKKGQYINANIRFRQGGEHCQPAGRAHTHELKKLFQEFNVPGWMRERVPLIYINDTLAVIVGYCYCQGFEAAENEEGIEISLNSDN